MGETQSSGTQAGPQGLLDVYDDALPQVYGYLLARCRRSMTAEDLTSDTFLAAVDSARRRPSTQVSVAWLIGIARHKLADHWRAQARDDARLDAAERHLPTGDLDPWDSEIDRLTAYETLAKLPPQYRAVLTLRYVDDLAVPTVAEVLGRTVQATEALLTRAKGAFRRAYPDCAAPARPTPPHGSAPPALHPRKEGHRD